MGTRVVTREDLESRRKAGGGGDPVVSVADASFVHAHPDLPLDVVLARLAQSGGLLPIASRTDARRVEGIVTAASVLPQRARRPGAR